MPRNTRLLATASIFLLATGLALAQPGPRDGRGPRERPVPATRPGATEFVVDDLPPVLAADLTVETLRRLNYFPEIDYSTALEGRVLADAVSGSGEKRAKHFSVRWHLADDNKTKVHIDVEADSAHLNGVVALLENVYRAGTLPTAKPAAEWDGGGADVDKFDEAVRRLLLRKGFRIGNDGGSGGGGGGGGLFSNRPSSQRTSHVSLIGYRADLHMIELDVEVDVVTRVVKTVRLASSLDEKEAAALVAALKAQEIAAPATRPGE